MSKISKRQLLITILFISISIIFSQSIWAQKKVDRDELSEFITAKVYQPDFPAADCNYHSLIYATDGKIYFSLSTHNTDYGARLFRFDPHTRKIVLLGKMDEATGENITRQFSQGKIHTRLFEHQGKLWFATHTSFYQGGLPGIDYRERLPFPGGHFISYDLWTGQFEDRARIFPNEGIISMTLDRENDILYGLTWPSGVLVSYELDKNDLRYWGAVQRQGEWGTHPWNWERICRTPAIDPKGNVYGSTMDGGIWKYDRTKNRRVSYIEGLDLSRVPFAQSAEENLKGDFHNNWRTIEWNPLTNSFWGIHFECSTLFEFDPAKSFIRSVTELRPTALLGSVRNPMISQLGFTIGPDNTIYYLAHGPGVDIEGRPEIPSNVYLITYDIDRGVYTDRGPILTADDRRVFFTESIAFGDGDNIYTAAWVEVNDPERVKAIYADRKEGAPDETKELVYEMLLVQFTKN